MDRGTIKQIGKDNVRRQWGELLLALVLVEAAGTFAALLTIGIGALVVAGPLDFGLTYLYYRQTQGEQPGQKMLLEGFKTKFGDSFLAGLLLSVISAVPAIVGLIIFFGRLIRRLTLMSYSYYGYYGNYSGGTGAGSFLLSLIQLALVVACVYITYGLCLSMYILVREPDMNAMGAIKKSWAMTKGQKLRLFVFDLSFIGWSILCCLTFGILLIWVAPYYRSARTVLFTDIYENRPAANPQPAEPAVPEAPVEPAVPIARFCEHCGAEIEDGMLFCKKCGAKL